MRSRHFSSSTFDLLAMVPLLLLSLFPPPGKELRVASSAEDPALVTQIKALSPTVSMEDASRAAACAYTTGLDLRRQWGVVPGATWLPGLQNLFIKAGARKGGYCFQYTAELLRRLDALKLPTLELHWAESEVGTPSENNALVVTARGQPFQEGVLFDNWRAQGHLVWTHANKDPEYHWKEGKSFADLVLGKASEEKPASRH